MLYFNIIIVGFIILATFIFLVRKKLIAIMSLSLRFGYLFCVILALSALFAPVIYNKTADFALKQTGIYENIQNVDKTLGIIPFLAENDNPLDSFLDFIDGQDNEEAGEEGYLEQNLYPSLIDLISAFLRAIAIVFAILGIITIIYLSYATSGITDAQRLEQRVAYLEQQLKTIK